MKPYLIVGGVISPNAIVVARDHEHAHELYERRFDTQDRGIGISEIEPETVVFTGGGDRYFRARTLSTRETATILAALRYCQSNIYLHRTEERDIATNYGEFEPMSDAEIDELCERLNFGDVVA
jgi:hypothetical protein